MSAEIIQGVENTNAHVVDAIGHLITAVSELAETETEAPLRDIGTTVTEITNARGMRAEVVTDINTLEKRLWGLVNGLKAYASRLSDEGDATPAPSVSTASYARTKVDAVPPEAIRDADFIKPRGSGRQGNRPVDDRSGKHISGQSHPDVN